MGEGFAEHREIAGLDAIVLTRPVETDGRPSAGKRVVVGGVGFWVGSYATCEP